MFRTNDIQNNNEAFGFIHHNTGKLLPLSLADGDDENANYVVTRRTWPDNVKFGVATAAYQIEGGWDADGKGEQVWDTWIHNNPGKVADHSNGDVASDSYHKYTDDVAAMKEVGVDYHRLSIAWSRILPNGTIDNINQAGIDYYIKVFEELKANGIGAMVTLYHWDIPTDLENQGGWLNPDVVDWFADYARLCYEQFGDYVDSLGDHQRTEADLPRRVRIWRFCSGCGVQRSWGVPVRQACSLAHAKAWHIFDEEFRSKSEARNTIVIDSDWYEPTTDSDEDEAAAEIWRQFIVRYCSPSQFGMYANPVYSKDWPQVMIDRIADRSEKEGFNSSRLPAFSDEEVEYISGTYDFLAVNHYTSYMVSAAGEPAISDPSFSRDGGQSVYQKDTWQQAAAGWFKIVPWGIGKLLRWIKKTYGNIEIVITENGVSDLTGTLDDDHRINYIQMYMSHILDAMYEEDVNVTAYTLWSIIDNFEWTQGFNAKLGIYYVNMSDPERPRVAKKSSKYYSSIIKTRCLVDSCT
ncbi:hypothetical protein NQ317_018902 [Molorchus minor]|uniref:beta-glucosidase n=1 Tax=Molorchus minor TaxID=1323400 RepID=A0ABQ9JM90_9CUCU|nr:hypothetical protein NQ317_018902 [Molorchus minor]